MTFEEFLKNTTLPSTAKEQLPAVLSSDTKDRLQRRDDAETILRAAIDEVDHGSVESVNTLVRKRL
jgi:hypothetical protein